MIQLNIINSITGWWFKKRISDLGLFLKNPITTQEEQLKLLLQRAQNTEFGKKNHFKDIKNYHDFSKNLSLNDYDLLLPYIERMINGESDVLWPGKIKWFAKSSGTTSTKSKFIPVSEENLEMNHFQGGKEVMAFYMYNYPNNKLLYGKTLKLGGSKELSKMNDSYIGDLSAILIDNMPFWSNLITAPEKKTALIPDWEKKLERTISVALSSKLTGLAGVPSWMLMFLKEVLRRTGKKNILEIWPDLEVFFHGGVSFGPYKSAFQKIIPSEKFNYFEIYNASEGFFALQDQKDHNDLLLMINHGIFFEFIPMEYFDGIHSKKIIPLQEVEIGKNYAMVISTNSGLWRYIIGDTIRFTSTKPYRIKITGRTKHFINVFGEEVVIENTDKAIELTAQQTGAIVKEYTLAPVFMQTEQKGTHEWIIEFDKEPDNFEKFKIILDSELQKLNSDYEAKRYKNMTLDFPIIHKAKPGLFFNWLKQKGKLGGQNKIPRLSNKRDYLEELLQLQNTKI